MVRNLVVVVGATGQQGGSVVKALLRDNHYNIRGVTSNVNAEASSALKAQGVQMVEADLDNADSVLRAFKGAYAIFGVTDFAEQARQHGVAGAQEAELRQATNIANAAAATPSLQHYIWSTIPSAQAISNGTISVPHFESKASVDEYILRRLEPLAQKTTFLWVGYYPSNIMALAMAPTFHATSGKYVWLSPVAGDTVVSSIGSQKDNVGLFVRAILRQPLLTLPSKYVMAAVEQLSLGEIIKLYGELTGRDTRLVCVGPTAFHELFPMWDAVRDMLLFWQAHGARSFAKHRVVPLTSVELSIDKAELVTSRESLKMLLQKDPDFWSSVGTSFSNTDMTLATAVDLTLARKQCNELEIATLSMLPRSSPVYKSQNPLVSSSNADRVRQSTSGRRVCIASRPLKLQVPSPPRLLATVVLAATFARYPYPYTSIRPAPDKLDFCFS
ncbi:hypothetical protein LTR35_010238 [Friedmanniomyces endolithicus]|uniref:NmrA-like domain-containing protein n=1 Tax=Friedmanniomyces endolithicus TaxID=329885 RepID=A0AAN6FBT9_9PEZI|nr:hypothetical protein LTR35_010238 [Friedmanniomyces endolithicus]KAK0282723.1 hypothetical protein LTS00_012025 [Friedmanniomyces endolithicus]KAK0311612.1 hypothetical protein LTR82_014314 [Friedmanniomyces endolithicus]